MEGFFLKSVCSVQGLDEAWSTEQEDTLNAESTRLKPKCLTALIIYLL